MIRAYQDSDQSVLEKIFELNIPENFAKSELNDFKKYLKEHDETYFVLLSELEIVGGFGYLINEQTNEANIKWIFTHPGFKKSGLGTEAVKFCLNIFKKQPAIKNVVVDTSQIASEFFSKFGFSVIYAEKDFWGKGLDMVKMQLKLR